MRLRLLLLICTVLFSAPLFAQVNPNDSSEYTYDTFFLAKKKGLFGKLGRSISEDPPKPEVTKTGTIKNDLPYNKYKGRIIRHIYYTRLGLDRDFSDTSHYKKNFGVRLGKTFHSTTREKMIRYNLFFDEGDKLFPLLLADNERHLREQPYLQDARIIVKPVSGSNEVDIWVITKDVFSIGGNIDISSADKGEIALREESLNGSGQKIELGGLYDKGRNQQQSFRGEFVHRNIFGSLMNWSFGFNAFNNTINTFQKQETYYFTSIDKPLVSPYIPWIGGLELSYHQSKNAYNSAKFDSLYGYTYYNGDGWIGYNLGSKRFLKKNINSRLRKFIAARVVHNNFTDIPDSYTNNYNYLYADLTAVLGSFTLLKQSFYKTKYIYGFGRRFEDVPEGFSASVVGGWTDKNGRNRPYYGLDFQRYFFTNKGNYFNYTVRLGAYYKDKRFEDFDVLAGIDFFTKLKKLGSHWYSRQFINLAYTRQMTPMLNEPLKLSSDFGIPIFRNGTLAGDMRSTLKMESVFYSRWRLAGFGFAPFVFGDACLLKPVNESFGKSDVFTSLGAGIRTRNESLVFGTMELKAYYFPRTVFGMDPWRVEFSTDIRFKYNSQFIRKPDFIRAN